MIKATLHILVGQFPIPITYPSNEAAEKQWRLITDMIAAAKESVIIIHDAGTVWIRLADVSAVTWTKEQKHPMQGIVPAAPGIKVS